MALTRITKGVIKPNENYDTHNINSTGIVTAVGADFSGNVSVGGVLTYEDVTSIDSVGIITAQSDIHVGAGVSAVGVGTFSGLDISGDIDVDGHTNLDNVSIAGISTFGGNVTVPGLTATSFLSVGDDDTINVGNGNDLKIYHQSSDNNSYIENDTGNLTIRADAANKDITLQAADALIFNTGGANERVRILSDGNVGIGSQTPNRKLSVVTDSNLGISLINDTTFATAGIYLEGGRNTGTGIVGELEFYNRRTSTTSNLQVNGDGDFTFNQKVGIGTNSPVRPLHIHDADCRIRLEDAGVATDVELQNNSGDAVLTTNGASNLRLQTNNSERLRITSSGTVNIGANLSQTTYPFSVQGSSNTTAIIKCSGNDTANLYFDANRNGAGANISLISGLWNGTRVAEMRFLTGSDTSNKDDGQISLRTASAGTPEERIRILSDGKVGIGTNNPKAQLEVYKVGTGVTATSVVRGEQAVFAIMGDATNTGASETDARLVFSSDGDVDPSKILTSPLSAHGFEIALINEEPGAGLRFHDGTYNKERLRIGVNGGVGIGTDYLSGNTSVYHKLMVEGDTTSQIAVAKIVRRNSSASNNSYTLEVDSSSHTSNVANGGAMSVDVNSGRAFTINGSGYVGIGTATPVIPLHIDGAADSDMVLLDTLTPGNYSQVRGLNNSGIRVRGGGSYGGGMIDLGGGLRGTDPGVIKFHSGTDVTANNPEHMRIQANGEIAMKSGSSSVTDALANLHVQNGTFMVSQANGVGTEYTKITTHTHSQDNDRHMFTGVSNGVVRSMIRKDGALFIASSYTAGRTRSDQNSPTNYYFNGSFGFHAYSGRTDDSNNYRTIAYIRAWDGGDTGDRNVIYYADSGSDTTTNDYDQHQKFGVKANGMAQFGNNVFAGRVESDEGSPNSVYTGSTGTTFIVYPGTSSQYTRMDGRTTDNTDQVFKADTGGGVVFKVESSGKVEADGAYATGASDYAEYFEWTDGNTSNEDRRGITVALDGEKIRPATDSDDASKIIGVVSALPAVVGDSAWSEWQLAHQKDAYGSWVTEDKEYLVWNKFGTFTDTDGVKKPNPQPNINDYNRDAEHQVLVSEIEAEKAKGNVPQAAIDQNLRVTKPSRTYNPDYDPSRDYVPRSHRKEWDAIGLVGKLVVRRGQPIGSNWILMKSNVGVDPNDNSIVLDKYLVR